MTMMKNVIRMLEQGGVQAHLLLGRSHVGNTSVSVTNGVLRLTQDVQKINVRIVSSVTLSGRYGCTQLSTPQKRRLGLPPESVKLT